MLSSSLDILLKVTKTTSLIKLFAYDCVTLYIEQCIKIYLHQNQLKTSKTPSTVY